ncbi:MAG: hypothetical protein H6868_02535 [Rhodospirillales bacterium]|nr:hypothetical protein [Rhodospirillales bacterium]
MTDDRDDNVIILGRFTQAARPVSEMENEEFSFDESPFLAFFILDEAASKYPLFDDLEIYLSSALGAINQDHARMVQEYGPDFVKKAGPMTGQYFPLNISIPYSMWADVVTDFQDKMRAIEPKEFVRVQQRAKQEQAKTSVHDVFSPQQIDIRVFGEHLVGGLKAFKNFANIMKRHLPELDVRPAVRLASNDADAQNPIVILSALVTRKDGNKNMDIREILSDYLYRARKGRLHLRSVSCPKPD